MAKISLSEQADKLLKRAESEGLSDNLFFMATFADYQRIRKNLALLAQRLDKEGVTRKDGSVNPCVSEYSKAATSAAAIAQKLHNMLGDERDGKKEKKKAVCPDFENLTVSQLKTWCQKFGMDYFDYDRKYLVKALKKKWEFEYGE